MRNKPPDAHRIWRFLCRTISASTTPNYVELTSDVVSAYVSNNAVSLGDLPSLIGSVHAALLGASAPAAAKEKLTPPVPINKTIRPDHIISLEDGRQYRSLKRHLTARGLSPEQYRAKWGLRPDYPMVAPSYSKARSELAKALGLGRKRLAGNGKRERRGKDQPTPASSEYSRGWRSGAFRPWPDLSFSSTRTSSEWYDKARARQ